MTFSVKLGDCSSSRQLLNVVTLKDPNTHAVNASISGGATISVDTPSLRVDELPDRGVWTVKVSFTGLSAWTDYIYGILQDGVNLQGSFRTMPSDQNTAFSFIIGTCDGVKPRNPTNTFRTIRQLVESSPIPVIHMFIIDDVHYADEDKVNDPDTGLVSVGNPQDTGLGSDYAKAWAANYGLLASKSKWMLPDRLWVHRNLPCCYSGGDHAIAGNWCRGNAEAGHNDYKKPCVRGPGSLEEVAGAEWDAFYGNINPSPLRVGQWYWGKDIGPVRLSLWDISKTSEPYDRSARTDTPYYGGQQINDHMNYLDVNTHPFKIAFHESGITNTGQPWLEWHRTEAEAWLRDLKTRPNLNGTDGNFLVIYGDVHSALSLKQDDFWAWGAGTLGDASAITLSNSTNWKWGGVAQYVEAAARVTADRFIHNFILVTVRADQSPKYLEISHIDGGRGVVKYTAKLTHKAVRNQMVQV